LGAAAALDAAGGADGAAEGGARARAGGVVASIVGVTVGLAGSEAGAGEVDDERGAKRRCEDDRRCSDAMSGGEKADRAACPIRG